MATSALVSTVVMGGFLLVVLAVVLRLRNWQHPSASAAASPTRAARAANGPLGWSIAFFVGAFGVMALGILAASGEPIYGLEPATLGLLVLGVLAVVVTVGAIFAVYAAVRTRGLNSAQAAGVSSALLGLLVLVAIVVQLFTG